MKNVTLICSLATLILFSCGSNNEDAEKNETTVDNVSEPLMDDESPQTGTFGNLFTCSPDHKGGSEGCLTQSGNCTTGETGGYNGDCQDYFTSDETSMTMTAGDDCRTVNTEQTKVAHSP